MLMLPQLLWQSLVINLWILAVSARRNLRVNSYRIAESSSLMVKALQEGLGAIRDVLLDGNQDNYLRTYTQADRPLRKFQATNAFITAFPRYALEALGMVAIALFRDLLVMIAGVVLQ